MYSGFKTGCQSEILGGPTVTLLAGLKIVACQWSKAVQILGMADENNFELTAKPN